MYLSAGIEYYTSPTIDNDGDPTNVDEVLPLAIVNKDLVPLIRTSQKKTMKLYTRCKMERKNKRRRRLKSNAPSLHPGQGQHLMTIDGLKRTLGVSYLVEYISQKITLK